MEGSEMSQAAVPSLNGCKNHEEECDHVHKRRHLMETNVQATSGSLIPAVEEGMHKFTSRKERIDSQLEDLRNEGLLVYETLKESFIDKMDRIKAEFETYQKAQKANWLEISEESQVAEKKLQQVASLVAQLNAATSTRD